MGHRITSRPIPGDDEGIINAIMRVDHALNSNASPEFNGLTLTGLTGIIKAIDGVLTSNAVHTNLADANWATVSDHDLRYYTETELGSNDNALGASLIGIEDSMSLYNATNVEAALAEVMDKVTPVTYLGDSITTTNGTVDAGDIESTWVIDDADTYDVSESGRFEIQISFVGISADHIPNKIQCHHQYNGNVSHTISVQLWNYTGTPQWDTMYTFEATGTQQWRSEDIAGTASDYVNGNGEAELRYYHSTPTQAADDLYLDFVSLKDDTSGGGGITEHGALSSLSDDDHTQYHTDVRAATWLTANHETTYSHSNYNDAYSHVSADGSSHSIVGSNTTAIGLNTTHRDETSGNPHGVTPTELNLVIGTHVQAWDAGLDSLSGLGYVSDSMVKITSEDTYVIRTLAEVLSDIGAAASGHNHDGAYQPLDAELTSLANLSYAATSFIKMTGASTFVLRTIGETKQDLSLDNVTNVATDDTIYDATSWNANADAATKNAIRDKIVFIDSAVNSNTSHAGTSSGNPHSVTPTELSLVIGTDVQAHGNVLDDLNTVGQVGADSEFLVGTGAGVFAWENAFTARTSLGVGTGDTPTFAGGLFTGSVTIFNSSPILTFKDSDSTGDDARGVIEWRDSNNIKLGYFGNSSGGNDELLWKNESSGGHIQVQTIGGGEFQIYANTVLTGILDINPSVNSSIVVRENSFGEGAIVIAELQGTTTGGLGTGFSMKDALLVRGSGADALLVFSNSDFTGTACIDYTTATDILSFKDATSYSFDAPVDFSSQNLTGIDTITSSAFVGPLTGQADTVGTIAGLAPDTATTQAIQANITSCANLATVGTIGTGVWEGTDVGILHGGTGQSSAQAAIDALTAVGGATDEYVLTKDTGTGNAVWKEAAGGGGSSSSQICDINGTPTTVYTKYFTGTTDSSGQTNVNHGISGGLSKILHASGAITTSSGTTFLVSNYGDVDSQVNRGFGIGIGATAFHFLNVATGQQSKSYIIKIDYIL